MELSQQTVYNNLQMKLAHTRDNGLSCLLVGLCAEGWVFFGQFCQSLTHLSLSSFCLRLNRNINNRLWELHGFQNNRMLFITDSITCCCQLKAYCGGNIARINLIEFLSLICMHLKNTTYTLLFALCSIQYIRTRVHGTRVHTEECEFSHKWVCHNFKCQCRERLIIRRMSLNLIAIHINTLDCWDIGRSWHIFQNCIKQFLNASISIGRTTAYRNSCTLTSSFPQSSFHCFCGRFFAFQIFHHQIIIKFADFLNQFTAV